MIYIRKLFTQDLRDGKQIAFPKEPSYDFFKFDYINNEADRHIEFIFETEKSVFKQFEGKKIETRLYSAGSESRIDGELKAFIRDEIKIAVDDLVVFKSDGRTNNKFKFNVILKTDNEYPLYVKIIDSANHTLIENESKKQSFGKIDKPYNRIIFGAPGTGKSHKLNKESLYFNGTFDIASCLQDDFNKIDPKKNYVPQCISIGLKYSNQILDNKLNQKAVNEILGKEEKDIAGYYIVTGAQCDEANILISAENNSKQIERITFHPNYSYAQFVGTYKPVQDDADEKQIKYEYVPGPFMRIYVSAKKNSSQNFLLLIEEINRANVAAVFGDVFQLLDRKSDGASEYPIAVSEDIKKYLAKNGIQEDSLSIPSNMYIWATMNSADQGVFPMDTAFKRRWEFEYIDINENAGKLVYEDNKPILIPIPIGNHAESKDKKNLKYNLYEWNAVREKINKKLSDISSVNEDKLLGPFFFSIDKLRAAKKEPQKFIELFKSKVLMYLFEDVVKISPTKLFVNCGDHPKYSTICSKFDEIGCDIFDIELASVNPTEKERKQESANE